MKNWRKILLSQNNLAKTLGLINFFSAASKNHHLEKLDDLQAAKVLVLAPHPDDDIFGVGGTLAKLHKHGTEVSVIYFCDGSGGVSEGDKKNKALVETRKKEAEEAGAILGINHQHFFNCPDGKLTPGQTIVKALTQLINDTKPDIIFVPSFLDNHPDHRATNEILITVVTSPSTMLRTNLTIWMYEVWTPLFPNRIINITSEVMLKEEAITKHKSQLETRGYKKAILGLNQYRAEINSLAGFAEAFFATTPEIYRKLYIKS